MARLRYNGLSNSLGASLTSGGTTITFASKLTYAGGDVPTISGSDYIPLSILDADGLCAEVVHLTAYTSAATTGTIARGKEDTTGVAHDSGVVVVNGPTAGAPSFFSGASLTKSSTQSIASNTLTDVTFNGEVFDTDGYHSTVSNTERLTAPVDGVYLVGGSVSIDDIDDQNEIILLLRVNGSIPDPNARVRLFGSGAANATALSLTFMLELTAGQYVTLTARHGKGSSQVISDSAGGTSFWITRLG